MEPRGHTNRCRKSLDLLIDVQAWFGPEEPLNLVSDGREGTSNSQQREEEKKQRSEPTPDKGHR